MKNSIFLILLITFSLQFSWAQLYQEVSFPSSDGLLITADLYTIDKNAPSVLMFHQSVSSRGEYRDIAPKLLAKGFNCIAVDLRWGKKDFWNNVYNETANRNGTYPIVDNYENTEEYQLNKVWPEIFKAYKEMEATLQYLNDSGFIGEKIVMGSSFSAMLAFKFAHEYDEIAGILAFSPGEYHPTQDSLLYSWARDIKCPVYISAGKGIDEYDMTNSIFSNLPRVNNKKFYQSKGRHGASVLINQEKDWQPLFEFLKLFGLKNENIGFRTVEISRTYVDQNDSTKKSKTIPISLWYPISQDSSDILIKMYQKDYVTEIKKDKLFIENRDLFIRILDSYGKIDSLHKDNLVNTFLNTEINVFNSPDYPHSQYPLVLICGGNPIYHIGLADAIARNGYVVASFPRLGIKEGERLPYNKQGSEEFRKDLEFVISSLSDYNFIDDTHLSFITWSFEGVPALETALSNQNTKLFVSFDSSIGYEYGNGLITDSTLFFKQKANFPFLHYTNSSMDFGKNLDNLNKLKTILDRIEIDTTFEMPHSEFTSIGSITIKSINKEKDNPKYQLMVAFVLDALRKTTANNG